MDVYLLQLRFSGCIKLERIESQPSTYSLQGFMLPENHIVSTHSTVFVSISSVLCQSPRDIFSLIEAFKLPLRNNTNNHFSQSVIADNNQLILFNGIYWFSDCQPVIIIKIDLHIHSFAGFGWDERFVVSPNYRMCEMFSYTVIPVSVYIHRIFKKNI